MYEENDVISLQVPEQTGCHSLLHPQLRNKKKIKVKYHCHVH